MCDAHYLKQTLQLISSDDETQLNTGLHQKRVYTSLGSSCPQCVHQILLLSAHTCMHFYSNGIQCVHRGVCIHAWADNNIIWCTHFGQEEPKLVYTLFWCKLVWHACRHLSMIHTLIPYMDWFRNQSNSIIAPKEAVHWDSVWHETFLN